MPSSLKSTGLCSHGLQPTAALQNQSGSSSFGSYILEKEPQCPGMKPVHISIPTTPGTPHEPLQTHPENIGLPWAELGTAEL